MSKKIIVVLVACIALLLAVILVAEAATGASTITTAATAATAATTAKDTVSVQVETCSVCHKDAGAKHQASYDELYQDGVIQVTDLKYSFTAAPDTTVITFKMTKNGAPFDGTQADSLNINFVPYDGTNFQFDPAADRLSLKGKLTYDGAGLTTSTLVEKASTEEGYVDYTDVSKVNGLIVVYGRDETVATIPGTRVTQNKYPFAALLQTGSGVKYTSAANNAGCVKCHTDPYLKHGYIYAEVNHDPATDFLTCKACHLDNGTGGHFEWQLLVDDPKAAAEFLAQGEEGKLTPEQEAKYAYNTTLMNDVHMSHAMEFPYPQSMSNCVTCHEGKLDTVLADANFTVKTCKSCHPVTGAVATAKEGEQPAYDTTKLALKTLLPSPIHDSLDLDKTDCTTCHGEGKSAPAFKQIHTGYDKMIYTADGLKYSEAVTVTVDSASFDGKLLDIKFSAVESPDIKGLDVATITPTVLVGLYGWDTKDYIVGPHERLIDDNKDGTIDSKDQRALEYVVGEKHPRFTTVSAAGGKWEVKADLSTWADLITGGTVKRVEIAVMPELINADGVMVAINAPSRTFDLGDKAFADDFYSPIAKVADGCNNCHDALATTFHSPDRSGNLVVCRLCHITKSGGSHLEMQSRSLDSYIHAIHSGQAFDVGSIDFKDPVQALKYEEHIGMPYPKHANTDCESCHNADMYNVPDQSKSLPGLLSASSSNDTWDRKIGEVPASVTGPASRACGGCHRAELINEDEAVDLVVFNQHIKQGGYLVTAGEDATATLKAVIDQIMAMFK
jgi:OmcA/MtrC family decaheme c-type cytochrome